MCLLFPTQLRELYSRNHKMALGLNTTKRFFYVLTATWYVCNLLPSYEFQLDILPIVHIGSHSWPLYFFVMDAITLISLILLAIILYTEYHRNDRLDIESILTPSLLIYPLINLYASIVDLTTRF